jgi:hypothetical protein
MDYYDAMNVCQEAISEHQQANAQQLLKFFRLYPNKNMLTSHIAGYLSLEKGKYIAEISFGGGMVTGTYIFGVAVIENYCGTWQRSKLSKCCSAAELAGYINQLDEKEED